MMNPKKDLYHYEERLARQVERIKNSDLSERIKSRIYQFQRDCVSEGIGHARVLRYLQDLVNIARWMGKDFDKATAEDIRRVVHKAESLALSEASKLEIKKTLKKFYKWLNGGEDYPDCVRWLKISKKPNNNKLPEELLTEDEIKRMISTARSPRDRALLSLLWETGCRAGEILTLQIKHVSFEEKLTRVTVAGKTGPRRMPLMDSTPYLAEWMANHPFKTNQNAYLWVGIGGAGRDKMMTYPALRKMLQEVARKAGIKKRVNPHNFRHSRSTYLAKHLTEAQMNQYLGWVPGSNMPATYVHLSGRDMDEAILKLRGVKPEEKKVESSLAPRTCPRCNIVNSATGKFCTRCGLALDFSTAIAMEDKMKELDGKFARLLSNKEVQQFLIKKMVELKIY